MKEDQLLATLLERLRDQGIDPLLLKGAALSRSVYPDAAMRPGSDIDMLVREDELQACSDVILGMGYQETYDFHAFSRFTTPHQVFLPPADMPAAKRARGALGPRAGIRPGPRAARGPLLAVNLGPVPRLRVQDARPCRSPRLLRTPCPVSPRRRRQAGLDLRSRVPIPYAYPNGLAVAGGEGDRISRPDRDGDGLEDGRRVDGSSRPVRSPMIFNSGLHPVGADSPIGTTSPWRGRRNSRY